MSRFEDWLKKELSTRNWRPVNLIRAVEISEDSLNRILSGSQNADGRTCLIIAAALKLPIPLVLRRAGFLPPISPQAEQEEKLLYYFYQLTPRSQKILLLIARTWAVEFGELGVEHIYLNDKQLVLANATKKLQVPY
jgi:hypothetical protein